MLTTWAELQTELQEQADEKRRRDYVFRFRDAFWSALDLAEFQSIEKHIANLLNQRQERTSIEYVLGKPNV